MSAFERSGLVDSLFSSSRILAGSLSASGPISFTKLITSSNTCASICFS